MLAFARWQYLPMGAVDVAEGAMHGSDTRNRLLSEHQTIDEQPHPRDERDAAVNLTAWGKSSLGRFAVARSKWLGSPRATLSLFAVCLLFLVLLISFMLVTVYRDAQARAETRGSAYSQVVATNIQWLMEASYQALGRIDAAVGDSLTSPPASAIEDLNAAVGSLPVAVQGWVFDAAGEPRLTNARSTQRVNVSDREYFIATRDGAEYFISSLLLSRSTNTQVFAVAKRIVRDGQFVGTAIIVIPAGYMETFRHSLELGPESTVGLLRSDGMMVSRSPVPEEATDLSGYVLFTDYLQKNDEGVYVAASPTDGIQRIVGYRRIAGFPLIAVASIAMEEAFTSFWQTVGILAAVVGPGILGLSFFGLQTSKAQVDLKAALDRNQTLFREIHHRVKNNLQQVLALIQLQPLNPETKAEMARRIGAMVSVHEHMYRSDQYEHVSANNYLPPLIEGVRSSFAKPVELNTDIAAAILDRDHALPLALICNEVFANAVKHAFPDDRQAKISVALEQITVQRAKLTIKDNGVGFDPEARSTGMGTRLIKSLAVQLDATVKVDFDNGTAFTLEFDVLGFGSTQAN